MFLTHLELTSALRPSLLPEETLLFVQNAVGLYEGKYKLPSLQDGQVYLTSHRICYVDNSDPRPNSVAIELNGIDRYDFYAGFLKSSPKVSLYPRPIKKSAYQSLTTNNESLNSFNSLQSDSSTKSPTAHELGTRASQHLPLEPRNSPRQSSATWVCSICSFSNPVPTRFDPTTATPSTPLPTCLACGIKPSFPQILKAAISGASGRRSNRASDVVAPEPLLESHHQYKEGFKDEHASDWSHVTAPKNQQYQCSRCTFLNHPSLAACELCGASLLSSVPTTNSGSGHGLSGQNLSGSTLNARPGNPEAVPECIKLSFRAGGEKVFYERLQGALVQRKWLLQSAPPIPESTLISGGTERQAATASNHCLHQETAGTKSAGIAGLERRGLDIRKKNEAMIGSAFEDLDALMASAKEIIALAESFAGNSDNSVSLDASQIIADSAKGLSMVATKDLLDSTPGSESLYLAELSRNLAEFLTDDSKMILKREGGIMSLVDLWAVFNRARGGVELVSPLDFEKAARLWEKLKLPVRLRQFQNGLLVVQQAERTDDKTIAQLLAWLKQLHSLAPSAHAELEPACEIFGQGVTAQEAAQRFGWSVGVATEELQMAEDKGALCREESVEGLRFWENRLVDVEERRDDNDVGTGDSNETRAEGTDDVVRNLKSTGLL